VFEKLLFHKLYMNFLLYIILFILQKRVYNTSDLRSRQPLLIFASKPLIRICCGVLLNKVVAWIMTIKEKILLRRGLKISSNSCWQFLGCFFCRWALPFYYHCANGLSRQEDQKQEDQIGEWRGKHTHLCGYQKITRGAHSAHRLWLSKIGIQNRKA